MLGRASVHPGSDLAKQSRPGETGREFLDAAKELHRVVRHLSDRENTRRRKVSRKSPPRRRVRFLRGIRPRPQTVTTAGGTGEGSVSLQTAAGIWQGSSAGRCHGIVMAWGWGAQGAGGGDFSLGPTAEARRALLGHGWWNESNGRTLARDSLPPLRGRVGRPSGRVGRGEPGFSKERDRHDGQSPVLRRCSPLPTPFGGHPPPRRGEGRRVLVSERLLLQSRGQPDRVL